MDGCIYKWVGELGEWMDRQKGGSTEVRLDGQSRIYTEQNANISEAEPIYKAVFCSVMTGLMAEEDFSDLFAWKLEIF
jgi:hypothetical protein